MSSSKTFIVTGASKGIGAAVVRYLVSQTHNVVLVARSREALQEIKDANPEQIEFIAGDMTDSTVSHQS